MSYRRSVDGDAESAGGAELNDDVQGHAFKSGRVSETPEPAQDELGESGDEDVEGHGFRPKADHRATDSPAADGDDVEGHARRP